MNALRLFPKMVIAVGIAFAIAGLVAAGAGIYIRMFVGEQLAAQAITTPEDATIPNAGDRHRHRSQHGGHHSAPCR